MYIVTGQNGTKPDLLPVIHVQKHGQSINGMITSTQWLPFCVHFKKEGGAKSKFSMSAAPSNITWEDWTPRHLDQTTPVVSGLDQDLVPRFWQNGSVLVWDYYPECGFPIMLSGNKLVTDKDNGMVFSVG